MAARFDAKRAARLGQNTGDGTPIMVTMKTDAPWVPLRILSLGLGAAKVVRADVFLLTDTGPRCWPAAPVCASIATSPRTTSLLTDLRSDKGMGWLPPEMWFTYLKLDVPARTLDYDLAVSVKPGAVPSLTAAGVTASEARRHRPSPRACALAARRRGR